MDPDRMMRNMMQSMGMNMGMNMGMGMGMGMGMPFGMFGQPLAPPTNPNPFDPMAMVSQDFMSPFSMMMASPFQGMQAMSLANNGSNNGTFSFCSTSTTSYTTDEHGRPQVYQQSQEIKQGPNGLKETKSAVRDSRSGHQELAIGHHIHDKSHVKKKSKNVYTGEEEQAEEFVNLDDNEADAFEENWLREARQASSSDAYGRNLVLDRARGHPRLAIAPSAHHDHPTNESTMIAQGSSAKPKKEKKKKSKIFKV